MSLLPITLRVFTKTTFCENSLLLYLPAIRGGGGKDGGVQKSHAKFLLCKNSEFTYLQNVLDYAQSFPKIKV